MATPLRFRAWQREALAKFEARVRPDFLAVATPGIHDVTLAVPDDGSHLFSPVFVENLVDGIVLAAGSDAAAGQVFTISDGIGVTNADFFGRYAAMLGIDTPFVPADELRARFAELEAADQAAGNPPGLNAETVDYFLRTGTYSIAKARRVLGYEPRVDLDEGMARTEAWLRGIGLLPTP